MDNKPSSMSEDFEFETEELTIISDKEDERIDVYLSEALENMSRNAVQKLIAAGSRSEERRVGKSVDLGGRRIIKKTFFQAEDGIRDMSPGDWSSDVCSSDL